MLIVPAINASLMRASLVLASSGPGPILPAAGGPSRAARQVGAHRRISARTASLLALAAVSARRSAEVECPGGGPMSCGRSLPGRPDATFILECEPAARLYRVTWPAKFPAGSGKAGPGRRRP